MRICMIGKFPPIEGGVSMHHYWHAHSMAALGHQVHVVTNAKEVEPWARMFMRREDWLRCEGEYPGGGYVRVHWTDPFDYKQRHIPSHNPFVTKLASLAAQRVQEHDLEIIFSYYLEPYGIAGYLTAQMTGRPHIVKHAGSDVGRLRLHPQFGPLYDHIFRSATRIVTGRTIAQQLGQAGLDERQLFLRDDFRLPEALFCPEGAVLDLERLFTEVAQDPVLAPMLKGNLSPRPPFLGVYGKLGEAKGTFDLLHAIKLLRDRGQTLSLIVVGHGWGQREAKFHETVTELGLGDCVTQLPFIPHWQIPEFIRMCQAVCFLERDFPISFHTPMIPREVLACAGCLVASAEILRRQLFPERLIHGFNCLAVADVHNTDELASKVGLALNDPERARQLGRRGHQYSVETEALRMFPHNYEALFAEVIAEHMSASQQKRAKQALVVDEFTWTHKVVEALAPDQHKEVTNFADQYEEGGAWALATYAKLLELVERGELAQDVCIDAVRLELRLAGILNRNQESRSTVEIDDGLFRLEIEHGAVLDDEVRHLCPIRATGLEVEQYEYDIDELLAARSRGELPLQASRRSSYAAIVPSPRGRYRVFTLSAEMVEVLRLCDGSRTVHELATELCGYVESSPDMHKKIVQLVIECFRLGLVQLITHRCSVASHD